MVVRMRWMNLEGNEYAIKYMNIITLPKVYIYQPLRLNLQQGFDLILTGQIQ